MIRVSASILGADLLRLGEEIELAEKSGVQWLHLDHMDGHFAPNISFGPDFVRAIRKKTDLFLDVHLMFTNPMDYVDIYCRAGSDMITVHAEADDDPRKVLKKIKANKKMAGICINPHTPPEMIQKLLPLCDHVLVMTVEPGFGGQKMRGYCLDKVSVVADMIKKTGREISIAVDGGVKLENAEAVVQAGANVLVMGTGFFKAENPQQVVSEICSLEEPK